MSQAGISLQKRSKMIPRLIRTAPVFLVKNNPIRINGHASVEPRLANRDNCPCAVSVENSCSDAGLHVHTHVLQLQRLQPMWNCIQNPKDSMSLQTDCNGRSDFRIHAGSSHHKFLRNLRFSVLPVRLSFPMHCGTGNIYYKLILLLRKRSCRLLLR